MESVAVTMMTPLSQLYAKELNKSLSGLGTDEESLVEILMSLSNFGVIDVSTEYENSKYGIFTVYYSMKIKNSNFHKVLCIQPIIEWCVSSKKILFLSSSLRTTQIKCPSTTLYNI